MEVCSTKIKQTSSEHETEEIDKIKPAINKPTIDGDLSSPVEPSPATPTLQVSSRDCGDIVIHDRIYTAEEVSYPLDSSVPSDNWKIILQGGDVLTYENATRDLNAYCFSRTPVQSKIFKLSKLSSDLQMKR